MNSKQAIELFKDHLAKFDIDIYCIKSIFATPDYLEVTRYVTKDDYFWLHDENLEPPTRTDQVPWDK